MAKVEAFDPQYKTETLSTVVRSRSASDGY
jgi:hypothetical protein